jgi:hypothetical protein
MTNVEDYLNAQKSAQNDINLLGKNLSQSYYKALEGIEGKLDRLTNKEDKDKFKKDLLSGLFDRVQGAAKHLEYSSSASEDLVMNMVYGFTKGYLNDLVERVEENLTFDNYMNLLSEETNLNGIKKQLAMTSQRVLDDVSAEDVLSYVGIEARDPSVMTSQHKATILKNQKEDETFREWLKKQPFM